MLFGYSTVTEPPDLLLRLRYRRPEQQQREQAVAGMSWIPNLSLYSGSTALLAQVLNRYECDPSGPFC